MLWFKKNEKKHKKHIPLGFPRRSGTDFFELFIISVAAVSCSLYTWQPWNPNKYQEDLEQQRLKGIVKSKVNRYVISLLIVDCVSSMNYPKRTGQHGSIQADPIQSPLTLEERKLLLSKDRKFLDVLRLLRKGMPSLTRQIAPFVKGFFPIIAIISATCYVLYIRDQNLKAGHQLYAEYLAEIQAKRILQRNQEHPSSQ